MIRTTIYEVNDYWAVDITEIGKQTDTYYFKLPEDAMRFKDQVDDGRRDTKYLTEQRYLDFNRMKDISEQLSFLKEKYDE